MLAGKLPLSLEGSDDVAQWYGRQLIILKQQAKDEPTLTPEEFIAKIQAVSAADIQRVAKEIFTNDRLNLAVISPSQDEAALKQLLTL